MNETWVRSPQIEDSYEGLHSFRPQVYFSIPQSRGINKVKIAHGGKEAILTETLDKGMTKDVTLEFEGVKTLHKRVYEAELEVNKLLRS
jgi:hypothetical protein